MCGIYGITSTDRNFIQSYIQKCSHRGPDYQDIWSDDYITLGHNLLAITSDPHQGKQPWINHSGVLVYNGEIFNYSELSSMFPQFNPKTTCDTELLSWMLEHKKDITQIDSMHAFAYYNSQNKTLVLSRDHAGIKPLYYAEISQGIVFGSEIKGMLDIVPNAKKIDPIAASCMSYTGLNPTRNTMYTNIKKVLPGETILYDITKKKIVQQERNVITPSSTNRLNLEQFRYEANQTVKMCTTGLRKFGVFLSGGLDSSLIAHELNSIMGEVNSFTNIMKPNAIIDGEDLNDDAVYAERLANDFAYNHTPITITPSIIKESWHDSIYSMEQPVYNISMPMYYHTNKVLSQHGIVVTMAGDMGDELLGGYVKYWKLRKQLPTTHADLVKKWMERIKRPIQLTKSIDKNIIHQELVKSIPEEIFNPEDPVNSYMALDCITQVPEEFFSRNDLYGMRFSMEGRFPLATKRFMSYCLAIHSDYKIGENKSDTKLPTKLAYQNILPNYIINKSKTGWTVPIGSWIDTDEKLKNFAFDYMNKQDGLSDVVSNKNWNMSKTKIISWMLRSWAQIYDLHI